VAKKSKPSNKGYLRSGEQSDQTSAKVDAGGGQMDAVRRELGLGAYAAGIGTTAAIGAGVAAVRSGRVVNPAAAARNLAKGEKVVVHGTPNQLQGKFIEPRAQSWGAQELGKPVVYLFDPRKKNALYDIPSGIRSYANKADDLASPTAVIGRTKKTAISTQPSSGYNYSTSPVSIDRLVKADLKQSEDYFAKQLQRELRKMGTQMHGGSLTTKIKQAKIQRQLKKLKNTRIDL
jgi:hypothetical protein